MLTSAGTAAGIDCCLHMVRQRYGAESANSVARRLVVPPHRQGGQAQFIEQPIDAIAALAGFGSPESLRLHFRRAFGVSPTAWRQTFKVSHGQRDGLDIYQIQGG